VISALLGFVPWYWWLGGALVVGLLAYLGLLKPLIETVVALAKAAAQAWEALPPRAKLAICFIAGMAALVVLHFALMKEAVSREHDAVTVERNTYWKAREDEANRNYAAALVTLHRKLEIADSNAAAAKAKHEAELVAKDAKHRAEMDAQDKERSENVTKEAVAACGNLHRGVIVQFNTGAARANGTHVDEDQPAAAARRALADEPSGIALDTYAAAVDATQDAVGDLRNQVIGWQKYHAEVVTPWIASTLDALSTCIPKGNP
jgi:hypothetical protein